VRGALRWNGTRWPDLASYVTAFVLTPLAALGLDAAAVAERGGTAGEWAADTLVLTEALAISGDINQLVKVIAARERPYVHALPPGQRALAGPDRNMSFYSGHTDLAFTAAVSAGTIASLKGYPSAGYIWAAGLSLASLTGYLRIAADRHYLLDVMAGAVAGSAVGVIVPLLHRPAPQEPSAVTGPSPAPAAAPVIGLRGTW
jgi:membrane-associated phospholipid phosphatase